MNDKLKERGCIMEFIEVSLSARIKSYLLTPKNISKIDKIRQFINNSLMNEYFHKEKELSLTRLI